jgi:hypothetical protein
MIPPRITFVVGPLAGPLSQWCERHQRTPSEAIRAALSAMLRMSEPAMDGRREHMQRVNAARARRSKKRQS